MSVKRSHGFTLIEVVVTLVILSILAAAALPLSESVVRRAKERELREALRDIRNAIDAYKLAVDQKRIASVTASGYPPSLPVLVSGAPDLSRSGEVIYFLRRVPRDPFCPPATSVEACWQTRSFSSPPTAPREGADVYDVLSRSSAIASDGRRYAEW